ncbi:guanine nucleotide-binding protein G(q) subunit alpha-like [Drosophila busckii]|uniref:guanine nucleotide-binding protein G(q) subunit alpha-like n=1 Tax=Drosophila busckii TaxID=30019 RepID=UPI00083EA7AB|nr:guanine nucleotide-binding protein G(q) subunit alpha-like [Drosophila busckii]
MPCCVRLTEFEREQLKLSREIEKRINQDRKEKQRELKILLLGTGEAGKSTFIKQMRILHNNGYSYIEKLSFSTLIFKNIVQSIQAMTQAMDILNIPFADEENIVRADTLMMLEPNTVSQLVDPYLSAIKALWADAGIQKCYARRREYQLLDSAKYYLDDLERISGPDYLPVDQDILRSRFPTTGLVEHTFEFKQNIFRMTDVGGQRCERKKWIHCFDNIASMIFLAALSEYDQVLFESHVDNRMLESVALFKNIINAPWFKNAVIVLFLNKKDIFDEKIMHSNLVDYFPKYKGPINNSEKAASFIRTMYEDADRNRTIYTHLTCATDTKNMVFAFNSVRDSLLTKMLKDTLE